MPLRLNMESHPIERTTESMFSEAATAKMLEEWCKNGDLHGLYNAALLLNTALHQQRTMTKWLRECPDVPAEAGSAVHEERACALICLCVLLAMFMCSRAPRRPLVRYFVIDIYLAAVLNKLWSCPR